MLFDTTLRRDLARGFGATLVVVLTVVITMILVRTLSLAAGDIIEPGDVMLVLGYSSLAYSATIISLSLFVAVVLGIGRMYRDSEMAIWFSAGLPLARFVRPVLRTFWPVLLVVALLVVFAWPWVNLSSAEIRERYAQRSDLARVTPGVFRASADGRRVFFVERDEGDEDRARNVFVLATRDGTESVVSARSGHVETVDDRRFLVLHNGQRSDVDADSGKATIARFDSYRVLISEGARRRAQALAPNQTPTAELVREPSPPRQGELVWRFGIVAAAVNLALLAVGLAHVNPRRPNNWNLLFALLAAALYFNLVNLSQTWVAIGRVRAPVAFFGLHGAAFVVALALLWWRDHASALGLGRRIRRGASA